MRTVDGMKRREEKKNSPTKQQHEPETRKSEKRKKYHKNERLQRRPRYVQYMKHEECRNRKEQNRIEKEQNKNVTQQTESHTYIPLRMYVRRIFSSFFCSFWLSSRSRNVYIQLWPKQKGNTQRQQQAQPNKIKLNPKRKYNNNIVVVWSFETKRERTEKKVSTISKQPAQERQKFPFCESSKSHQTKYKA